MIEIRKCLLRGVGREKDFSRVMGMFYSLFQEALTQVHTIVKTDPSDH